VGGVTLQTHLLPVAPFDFDVLLAYISTAPLASLERVEGGRYRRAIYLDGRDVLLSMQRADAGLLLSVQGADARQETLDAASALVRRAFNLDLDPAPYLAHVASDAVLGPLARRWTMIRPVLLLDPFEALLWAVLGQQINVGFARKLKGVLVELCGRSVTIDGEAWPLFPPAEAVAALAADDLTTRQFSRAKTRYVLDLSASVANGDLDLAAIGRLPRDEAIAELTRQRGIGRWTAEYLLMRVYGDLDALPAGDVSLHKIIGEAVVGRRVSEAELRALAEPWAPWRGWAAFTFWCDRQLASLPRSVATVHSGDTNHTS
jgi:DNA-3-methyladenine glycosylase II